VGFISPAEGGQVDVDPTEAINEVARRLGRPPVRKDADGYEREIVGACVSADGARLAWIEGRSKLVGRIWDVEFVLHATVDGRETITWTVDTYNPFFGCAVGWMGWMGDDVVAVYREKHRTIVAVVRAGAAARLVAIDDEWSLTGDVVYYASEEDALVEGMQLPTLARLTPLAASAVARMTEPLRAPLATDATAFQSELRGRLFGAEPPQPEADLVIGALAFRFWDQWPAVTESYDAIERFRFLSPRWLPFYWHVMTHPQDGGAMLRLLDGLAAGTSDAIPTDALTAAAAYVRERSRVLAAACRAGALPAQSRCFFWVDWSRAAIEQYLRLFPEGFRRGFEGLRPEHERWRALGDHR
jgi:hypothetical protein